MARLLEPKTPTYVDGSQLPAALNSLLGSACNPPSLMLLVPLMVEGTSVGLILLLGRLATAMSPEFEAHIAALLGFHAAAAIKNAESVRTINIQLFETVARGKREWEQTFDAISDGIFITNTDHLLIRANKTFVAGFGKHPRDIIGKRCYQEIWGSTQPCVQCPIDSLRENPHRPPSEIVVECVVHGNSSVMTAYPMVDPKTGLSAIVHVVKDVTEQKKMQEIIIRAEKLRAVGEMASGIAHDFNNILASIIGWNEIMLLSDLPQQLKECAAAIHQAAVDGTETVKRIQEYTRIRKDTEFDSVDVNEIVRGAIELARPRWKDWAEKAGIAIIISTEFASIPPARGNAPDLREVFLNIIFNAIDAMPLGGEIRIRTGMLGENVYASIEDSGTGMPEEVQRRVFDPFFTTKGSGGSGLGLSVAYGIVSRHGGDLTVESEPGRGSKFTVALFTAPVLEREPEIQVSHSPRILRVLLIDDDHRVLEAIGAMLQADGHSLVKCHGGKQALAEFANGRFDLVITDLGMPEMNGWEVAAKVKSLSGDTPVIFLTGWGAEIATERLSELGVDAIIQKPCQLTVLRQTIDHVVGREKSSPKLSDSAHDASKGGGSLNILVIEDNQWFGEALNERLAIDGHRVSLARSGQSGLQDFNGDNFDLVLCDLKLPDMSGLEVAVRLGHIRRRPFVVIMTGSVANIDRSLLQENCIDAILRKPWKDIELQRVLDAALQQKMLV
ncbi:MAG: response regulator [Dehalococcoidia bacterium]|nr:response regulator [Dehalococcoidia bacterium]